MSDNFKLAQYRLDPLAKAWLEELGLLQRLPGATAHDLNRFMAKAQQASDAVRAEFERLRRSGGLKSMCQGYRKIREEKARRVESWPAVALRFQINMVRAMAREQRDRARRGLAV